MLKRSVIFTNAPLLKEFRYRDLFQLVPMSYFPNAPKSAYMTHFPAFLEYKVDNVDVDLVCEQELRDKGISDDVLRQMRNFPIEIRTRKEILYLMSSLTNFHFFEYNTISGNWGIQYSIDRIEKLDNDIVSLFNNQPSSFYFNSYLYEGLKDDLVISEFTQCHEYYVAIDLPKDYFTINSNIESNPQIKIPCYLDFVLDRYYLLGEEDRKTINQCLGLLETGIELFDKKRSISFLSVASSIEEVARLDWIKKGKDKKLRATQ